MPGPANAGIFVYAKNMKVVAKFYESVVGMKRLHETSELIVLESADIQLLVHKIPENISTSIKITEPPEKRENVALKFFFTVLNLNESRSNAVKFGGEITNDNWQGPGFTVCNAIDPEGNVFHVREKIA